MKALFILLYRNMIKILSNAIKTVRQSVIVSLPITKQMETIRATEATFTASKKTVKVLELRIFFTNELSNPTKTNDGRKIPIVETMAPDNPLI